MNPNSLKNLRPIKPGQSGNPAGRPVGARGKSTIAKQVLNMVGIFPKDIFEKIKEFYPGVEKTMTIEEMMTIVQASNAITKGDTAAYKSIMDIAYGDMAFENPSDVNFKITIKAK